MEWGLEIKQTRLKPQQRASKQRKCWYVIFRTCSFQIWINFCYSRNNIPNPSQSSTLQYGLIRIAYMHLNLILFPITNDSACQDGRWQPSWRRPQLFLLEMHRLLFSITISNFFRSVTCWYRFLSIPIFFLRTIIDSIYKQNLCKFQQIFFYIK